MASGSQGMYIANARKSRKRPNLWVEYCSLCHKQAPELTELVWIKLLAKLPGEEYERVVAFSVCASCYETVLAPQWGAWYSELLDTHAGEPLQKWGDAKEAALMVLVSVVLAIRLLVRRW